MNAVTRTFTESQLTETASWLIEEAKGTTVWLYEGPMGAGKTTLIKEVCAQLGVVDNVSSPTFSLVNEYETEEGESVYHFDFYRINDEQEALDMGVLRFIRFGTAMFSRMAHKDPSCLSEDYLTVEIAIIDGKTRTLEMYAYGQGA